MTDDEIAELDAYLDDLVDDWPPLTDEQITRVQTLLNTTKLQQAA